MPPFILPVETSTAEVRNLLTDAYRCLCGANGLFTDDDVLDLERGDPERAREFAAYSAGTLWNHWLDIVTEGGDAPTEAGHNALRAEGKRAADAVLRDLFGEPTGVHAGRALRADARREAFRIFRILLEGYRVFGEWKQLCYHYFEMGGVWLPPADSPSLLPLGNEPTAEDRLGWARLSARNSEAEAATVADADRDASTPLSELCGADPASVRIEFNPSLGEPWYDPADDEEDGPFEKPEINVTWNGPRGHDFDGCIPLGLWDGDVQVCFDPATQTSRCVEPDDPVWLDWLPPPERQSPGAAFGGEGQALFQHETRLDPATGARIEGLRRELFGVLDAVRAGEPALCPPRPVGGYFADDYAAKLRAGYRADPARFWKKERGAFRALRDAAGLTEAQERTVKRQLGYEGKAVGFRSFVVALFAAEGENVPE